MSSTCLTNHLRLQSHLSSEIYQSLELFLEFEAHLSVGLVIGLKSKVLSTCGRFSCSFGPKYGGPGLETRVVMLLKQNAMHYHSKLFVAALKWSW